MLYIYIYIFDLKRCETRNCNFCTYFNRELCRQFFLFEFRAIL